MAGAEGAPWKIETNAAGGNSGESRSLRQLLNRRELANSEVANTSPRWVMVLLFNEKRIRVGLSFQIHAQYEATDGIASSWLLDFVNFCANPWF